MSTKIEWTDETYNPVTGCTKVSAGCRSCYAERMSKRLAGRCGYPEVPHHFDVTLHPDRLDQPLHWRKPRRIFVCSMGDLFHEDVPNDYITMVFDVMCDARTQEHTFQVLTKRPEHISEWLNWVAQYWPGDSPFSICWEVTGHAPSVWIGVSAENQETADERIPILLDTPAAVRFVSCEPLLGPVDLSRWLGDTVMDCPVHGPMSRKYWTTQKSCTLCMDEIRCSAGDAPNFIRNTRPGIEWVIVGGETGPGARPMNPDWARDIRDQCQEAGVPFFFKQMSGRQTIPDDLQIREIPSQDQ